MQVINQQERRDMFWRFFYLYLASFILVGFLVYHNAKVPTNDKVSCKELDLKNLQTQALSNMGNTLMALDQTPKANIATYTSHKAAFEKQSNSFISQIDTAKYRDLFQIYTAMSAYYFAIESKGAASSQIEENLKKQYETQLQAKDAQIQQMNMMMAAMAAKGGGAAPPPPPAAAAAGSGGGDGGAKFKLKMSQSATDIEAKIQEIKQSANLNLGDAKCNVDKTRVNQALSALQKTAEVLKSN
jgi:hypothetical protein